MIGPPVLGCLDVFGLPLLSPAGQQKDNVFTVISEIHSVSRAIIDFILETPPPTLLTFEVLPFSSLAIAAVTLAAALASKLKNHSRNRF
jgi:hypothetical protein